MTARKKKTGAKIDTCYSVTVSYREPTYELAAGPKPDPYRWTYEIEAPSEDEAAAEAGRRFREMARVSGVGWQRDLVRIDVKRATNDTGRETI